MTTELRPVVADDLDRLVDLHIGAFGLAGRTPAAIRGFYRDIAPRLFDDVPPGAPEVHSLVAEREGRLDGVVFAAPRAVTLDGETRWAAVTSQLAVSEAGRTDLLGIELLRAVFAGPQDLTFADRSNPLGRQALRAAGATHRPELSLRWSRVLRPTAAAAAGGLRRTSVGETRIGQLARRAAMSIDRALPARAANVIDVPEAPTRTTRVELTAAELAADAAVVLGNYRLSTSTDAAVIEWSMNQLDRAQPHGTKSITAVRAPNGRMIGWFTLNSRADGVAEVVQLVAAPRLEHEVVAHLLHHALDREAVSLHGSVMPALMTPLGDTGAVFHTRNANFSVHSENTDILDAFAAGSVMLTGLDGEYLLDLAASERAS